MSGQELGLIGDIAYIAGGIVPRLDAIFAQSDFRLRFESKGRFRNYLVAIPSYVIIRSSPAFLGAKQMLWNSCKAAMNSAACSLGTSLKAVTNWVPKSCRFLAAKRKQATQSLIRGWILGQWQPARP